MQYFVTDATIRRFLGLKSWKSQKASKAMKEAIRWRLDYKPEAIRWEDVAQEAGAGKIYRADYSDKQGRTILVVRPGSQRSKSSSEQLRCFVYHLENAMMSMADGAGGQDQQGVMHILQNYYPDMVGIDVVHNPPRLFQAFWKLMKAFIDDPTYESTKFVYTGDAESQKVMTHNLTSTRWRRTAGRTDPGSTSPRTARG